MLSDMGKSSQWLRMMASETTGTEFSLVEQGTGIGHSTLPTVGYLGKVFDSCKITSEECCPACKLQGRTQTLQAFRISLKESIVLCENPQCIYPLGHKPLNTIITTASVLGNHQTKPNLRKRKIYESAPHVSLSKTPVKSIEPCAKEPKTNIIVSQESSLIADFGFQQNGELCDPMSLAPDLLASYPPLLSGTTGSLEHSLAAENITIPNIAPTCPVQISNSNTKLFPEKLGRFNPQPTIAPEIIGSKLLGGFLHLQWRNRDALCWLDCIMSALVHLETMKKALTEVCTEREESIFQQLFSKYNQANAMTFLRREDGNAEASLETLVQAEKHLNEIRSTFFYSLQPQLKCQLGIQLGTRPLSARAQITKLQNDEPQLTKQGKNDSPVFALPLLLEKDPSLQNLFMHSFSWKFECLLCGFKSQDRCNKTLTTFTKVIPEWHPLQAVHVAPCNSCHDQCQRREMVLEKVPAVFMLHFSEGLPHGDLKAYSFQFEGVSYEITVVIRYQTNHFATWALTSEGSWLECDDLKGPYCLYHEKCEIPPSEIHIIFWERNIKTASELNSQFQHENAKNVSLNDDAQSSSSRQCDDAALLKVDISSEPSTESPAILSDERKSIFGFKDLADDEVITLTLVEVQVDSVGKPVENDQVFDMDNTEENDALQPQENTSAPFLQTSYQGDTSPNITAGECKETQSSSICIQLGQSNPTIPAAANLENHSTCIPTVAQAPERSQLQRHKFNDNSVITHEHQFSPPCKRNKTVNTIMQKRSDVKHTMDVVENQVANDPIPLSKENKGISGSWVNSLLGRHPGLPSRRNASNQKPKQSNSKENSPQEICGAQQRLSSDTSPLKVADAKLPVKVASSFGGFMTKGVSKTIEESRTVPTSVCRRDPLPPCPAVGRVNCTENNVASVASPPACKFGGFQSTPDKGMSLSLNGLSNHKGILNGHQKFVAKNGESVSEHKIHRLRLKLLKKLKAKKDELASLDMLAHSQGNGRFTSKTLRNASVTENKSKHDSLQDLLKALQEHIDIADNESVYTMSSNTSLCSSPGDAEFLSELLSPATVSSIDWKRDREDGSKLLEMLVDRNTATSQHAHQNSDTSCPIIPVNGQNDYRMKEKQSLVCSSNSISNGSSFNSSAFECAAKEDVLEDLLSSTFSSVGGDADLHHFDEHFFES